MPVQHLPTNNVLHAGAGLLDALQQWRDTAWTSTSECHVPEHRAIDANRATIERAKGVLMGRHGMNPLQAFTVMVKRARQTHTPVHTVARELIQGAHVADPWPERRP